MGKMWHLGFDKREFYLFIYLSEAFLKQYLPVRTIKDEWLVISKQFFVGFQFTS